jgi:surface polysaccharide O-acyltransferase-like enzyme
MFKQQDNYIYEIHILRACACLMLLMVHVTAQYYQINNHEHHWFTYFFNQICRFGSPIFVVISGFLLFYQVKRRGFVLKSFLYSRTTKIVLPFLFWTVFYLVFSSLLFGSMNYQGVTQFLIENIYKGKGYYHLWFISVVIQLYFLFPFLQAVLKSFTAWMVGLAISFIISAYFIQWFSVDMLPLGRYLIEKTFVLHWVFYFIFGGFLAFYWTEIKQWCQKHQNWFMILVCLVLLETIWEYSIVGSVPSKSLGNLLKTPILVLACFSLYPKLAYRKRLQSLLIVIGKYSMGIYLLHPLLLHVPLPTFMWIPQAIFIDFIFYLTLSIIAVKLVERLPYHPYILPIPMRKKEASAQRNALNQVVTNKVN